MVFTQALIELITRPRFCPFILNCPWLVILSRHLSIFVNLACHKQFKRIGQNLTWVFDSRSCCVHIMHSFCCESKVSNLALKTRHKQFRALYRWMLCSLCTAVDVLTLSLIVSFRHLRDGGNAHAEIENTNKILGLNVAQDSECFSFSQLTLDRGHFTHRLRLEWFKLKLSSIAWCGTKRESTKCRGTKFFAYFIVSEVQTKVGLLKTRKWIKQYHNSSNQWPIL